MPIAVNNVFRFENKKLALSNTSVFERNLIPGTAVSCYTFILSHLILMRALECS